MVAFTGFGVISEWLGQSGAFLKVVLVPKCPPKPAEADTKEVLEKWLGFQFQMMVIAQLVYMAYWILLGGTSVSNIVTGVQSAIYLVLNAFVNAWIFWFSFAKREPPCCCFIQGFKYQFLIVGVYFVVTGVLALVNWLLLLVGMIGTMNTTFFAYLAYVVVYTFQVVGMIGSGWCMVKMGGKEAGIEIPDAKAGGTNEAVGRPGEVP